MLGVSVSSSYELMHEKDFPAIRIRHEKYVREFMQPQEITQDEVEQDMKIEITFFKGAADMKNTVTITLDDAKVSALKMYLAQKNSTLDNEITRIAEQLYGKIVPQNVRDFIDMTAKQHSTEKPKPSAAKPTDTP